MSPTLEIITAPVAASGLILRARELAAEHGGNFRAPHHTASQTATAAEMAIAAGGVLLLDEPAELSRSIVSMIADTWNRMDPSCRPRVILTLRGSDDAEATAATLARVAELFAGWVVTTHHTVGA